MRHLEYNLDGAAERTINGRMTSAQTLRRAAFVVARFYRSA
ncbi:MAG: hypothetical protein M5U05_04020 [Anaerolineales bacterium]|nr:hypothetical protein [Anaerolineales bacterium]